MIPHSYWLAFFSSDAWSCRNIDSSIDCNFCGALGPANASTSAHARLSRISIGGPLPLSTLLHPNLDSGSSHNGPLVVWSSFLNRLKNTRELFCKFLPVIAEFFNQRLQLFILCLCPALFGLICESSEAAVAHFSISSWEVLRNLIKQNVGIRAEFHE